MAFPVTLRPGTPCVNLHLDEQSAMVHAVVVPACRDPAPQCCVTVHRSSLGGSLHPKQDKSQEEGDSITKEAVPFLQALQMLREYPLVASTGSQSEYGRVSHQANQPLRVGDRITEEVVSISKTL